MVRQLMRGAWLVVLTAILLIATGCGGTPPTAQPPAGAAAGLNTFVLFFTEN